METKQTWVGFAPVLAVMLLASACQAAPHEKRTPATAPATTAKFSLDSFRKPREDVLRRQLTPLQFEVTQRDGTERPFDNAFWDKREQGIYVDIVSGEPLFSSRDKFKSGTGWPSFTRPIDPRFIVKHEDKSLGVSRIEVRSKHADSHLGHVFSDGPAPSGLRYCINSAALRFIPLEELAQRGYGAYVRAVEDR